MTDRRDWREKVSLIELSSSHAPEQREFSGPVIGLGDGIDPDGLLALAMHGDLQQLVQRSNPALETDITTAALMLCGPDVFLAFPVSSILDPERAGASRESELLRFDEGVSALTGKGEAIDSLGRFLESLPLSRRFRYDCTLAADELCSNALLSAPRERRPEDGGADGALGPLRPARVFAGLADGRLIIGCADDYGTLKIGKMLARIRDCYQCGPTRMINFGGGGAGIGTYLAFDACTSFYIAVKAGSRTVICCDFPTHCQGGRVRRAIPKSLHLLVE